MTPQFERNQNRNRLIGIFLSIVVLVIAFKVFEANQASLKTATYHTSDTTPVQQPGGMFVGLRKPAMQEIADVWPAAAKHPALLEFGSRFCTDCQRIKPVIEKLLPHYPTLAYHHVDVLEDVDKQAAFIHTFKPVSVPVMIFMNEKREITQVLYNYQSPEAVKATLDTLTQKPTPKTVKPS